MTKEILFYGTFEGKIDSKSRVSVPTTFRQKLDNSILMLENKAGINCCFSNNYLPELIKKHGTDILPKIKEHKISVDGRISINSKNSIASFLGKGDFFELVINT